VPTPEGSSNESLALLFVSDSEAEAELPTSALSRLYGLTPAEAALVRELANGRSIQEAAVRLGITIGTARQRLVQIFDKTGTERQASLVRLVLTGPEGLSTRE
jgi:DNA-binding CsgD family transcriptional regulator